MHLGDFWNPGLYLDNQIRTEKESQTLSASSDPVTLEVTAIERRRIRATFFETLELEDFPFDDQVHNSFSIFPASDPEEYPGK